MQSLFMDKFMKSKWVLGLIKSLSLGCKTVIFHLGNFDDLIQSGFWVISISSDPLDLETEEREK